MRTKIPHFLLLIIFAFVFSSNALADITGKISGKVVDSQKKDPIPGVTVMLEGTRLGAATNIDGNFIINNIPPGNYNVTFTAVGYGKKQIKGVKVSSDFTTKLNTELSEEAVQLGQVVVEAETPLVRTDLTSSHATIDVSQIEELPVESVSQILTLQAGISVGEGGELHIRGGRSNEVNYTVNGISVSNPFDNSPMVNIATNAVQELSVVSGTFNAEYGNALSGIVNTVTREGGEKYHFHFSYYTGDKISNKTDRFFNVDAIDVLTNQVIEGTFGGPIPYTDNMFSTFLSWRNDNNKGWLFGKREHQTTDSVVIKSNELVSILSTGDGKIVPMNPSWSNNFTGKLTFRPSANIKINYDAIFSQSRGKSYSHIYKYTPDATTNYYEWGLMNALDLRHTVGNSTFYSLKAGYNVNDSKSFLYPLVDEAGNAVNFYAGMDMTGLKADPRYQSTKPLARLTTPGSYSFYYGGNSLSHYYDRSKKISAKFDLTSQVNQNHELKFGSEFNYNELKVVSFSVYRDNTNYVTPTIPPAISTDFNSYSRVPIIVSGYVQDKMEYENFILNFGLRYDYFQARAKYITDYVSLLNGADINSVLAEAKGKHQISPRIGISFPITDKGIIHLSYGHFFQMPSFTSLYANPDFKFTVGGGNPTFGNANLDPEKTVTYEIGLQQQLLDDLAFNVTTYFKDVRGLLALRQIRVSSTTSSQSSSSYYNYVNLDYGNIKGVTFTLTKRKSRLDNLGLTIDYTYQVTEGADANADAFFINTISGQQSELIPIYLDWDQAHILNASLSYSITHDLNLSLIGKISSGRPYTPKIFDKEGTEYSPFKTNSERIPYYSNVDLMAQYDLRLYGYTVSFFLKVFNLFDFLVDRTVNPESGTAAYSFDKAYKDMDKYLNIEGAKSSSDYLNNPTKFYSPREVRFGLSIDF